MKKMILVVLISLLTITGVYYANTYTSAMVENIVSIIVTYPHGMLSIVPAPQIIITQGDSKTGLTLTNNMAVPIDYRLEYANHSLQLSPASGALAPGSSHDMIISVNSDCPPGDLSLVVVIFAEYNGGRARVKTTVPIQVAAPPPPAADEPEETKDSDTGQSQDPENGNSDQQPQN